MSHIAYGIEWWTENFIKGNEAEWAPKPVVKKKEALIQWIKQAYASLRQSFSSESLSDKKVMGIHATLDHITHHRGQCVLYLRCSGLNPPEYTY